MKIKLTKKRNSVSVRFTAENDTEGVDLKDIVLAAGSKRPNDFLTASTEELGKRGYTGGVTKETRNTKEFTLQAPGSIAAMRSPVKPKASRKGSQAEKG
jgi:hypothetical protein